MIPKYFQGWKKREIKHSAEQIIKNARVIINTLKDDNIDPKTGKISQYHKDNCSGCSLCED